MGDIEFDGDRRLSVERLTFRQARERVRSSSEGSTTLACRRGLPSRVIVGLSPLPVAALAARLAGLAVPGSPLARVGFLVCGHAVVLHEALVATVAAARLIRGPAARPRRDGEWRGLNCPTLLPCGCSELLRGRRLIARLPHLLHRDGPVHRRCAFRRGTRRAGVRCEGFLRWRVALGAQGKGVESPETRSSETQFSEFSGERHTRIPSEWK